LRGRVERPAGCVPLCGPAARGIRGTVVAAEAAEELLRLVDEFRVGSARMTTRMIALVLGDHVLQRLPEA
jgi:hypothetical protein